MLRWLKPVVKRAPFIRDLVHQRDTLGVEIERLRNEWNDAIEAERRRTAEGRKDAYSHWGEDQIVRWLFTNHPTGFYVDVGAYHPTLYSNTKLLADRGWRGVNVDCNPAMIEFHRQLRPNDTNVHAAIAREEGTVTLYLFDDWASSNTISASFAEQITRSQDVPVKRELAVPAMPLRALFDRYVPAGTGIDFLNIDIETVDVEALESNDWSRYRPLVIAIEDLYFSFDAPDQSPSYRLLRSLEYRAISRSIYTNFFVDDARSGELYSCP